MKIRFQVNKSIVGVDTDNVTTKGTIHVKICDISRWFDDGEPKEYTVTEVDLPIGTKIQLIDPIASL